MKTFTVKLDLGFIGPYTLCRWEANTCNQARREFLKANPSYKDGHKGHVYAEEVR